MEEEVFEQEWALVQILQNPVLFREFINEDDPNWHGLELHERAWSTCTSHYISMCCGRSVHKTTTMIEMLYYWMINKLFIPGDPGLFVLVPNKAQKDLAFFRIRSACLTHWLIKQYGSSINVSEGKIDFQNGFQLLMRIAGAAGSEANVIGVHTFRIWVDEAQDLPWRTWLSLQNCLKPEIDEYQMFTSGVPNGERRDNVLYTTDQLDEKYTKFNAPQTIMSWWSPELEYTRRKEYFALQEDSEDFKHYVLGQHGVPTFSVFDRTRFMTDAYDVQLIVLNHHMFEGCRRKDMDGQVRYHLEEILAPPPIEPYRGAMPRIGLGYDVGFSPDPGVYFIMYEDLQSGKWKNLARIVMQRVEYALQREVLVWLDRIYKFEFIGIDMGGPGKVQYQDLSGNLNQYNEYNYLQRLYPVEFGSFIVVAVDEDGNEKKEQMKKHAVETLSRWVQQDHAFVFSKDDDNLMAELERTKFRRTITGEPVYFTDDDHQMAAMMCAIMAYENTYGVSVLRVKDEIKIKLLPAKWLMT
jgi:hypothetical protein